MVERKDLKRNKNTIDAANNDKGLKDNYNRKVDPSIISSVSTIKTFQETKGNKTKFEKTFTDDITDTNLKTGYISTMHTSQSDKSRYFDFMQKRKGDKSRFEQTFEKRDASGNLIVESKKVKKNYGLGRNREKVKYHDKSAKKESKQMEKDFKNNKK